MVFCGYSDDQVRDSGFAEIKSYVLLVSARTVPSHPICHLEMLVPKLLNDQV